jgi:16S rRNA (uracil1498-N3)-methyltransferase
VQLFDGQGGQATAEITQLDRHGVEVAPGQREHVPRPIPLHLCLAAAVCKGPRQDWLIEKCTELGVPELFPILTERSVVRPARGRAERWRRLSIEAAKQSQQAWLPTIHPPCPLASVLEQAGRFDAAWIALPTAATELSEAVGRLPGETRSVMLLIGPEGGFSAEELTSAERAGLMGVRLGGTILRVETAAIAAAAVVLLRQRPSAD